MTRPTTFTDREATGGDTASRGLRHQEAVMLAWLPGWLASSSFSTVSYEILGDIEAKFFDPEQGEVIEFYQVKDKSLTPSELFDIIRDFQRKDESAPYRHFFVVCSGLSATASPIGEALERIRHEAPEDAAPFYDETTPVKRATEAAFLEQVKTTGGGDELGYFLLRKVTILHRHGITEDNGTAMFQQKLATGFPEVEEFSQRAIQEILRRVHVLITGRRAQPITRQQLVQAITDNGKLAIPSLNQVAVRTQHNDVPYYSTELTLPWQRYFGGPDRSYPPSDEWNQELLGQLSGLKRWLNETAVTKNLIITGKQRITANLALGWTFSAVAGYNLAYVHQETEWRSERHPNSETPDYRLRRQYQPGLNDELMVTIGICRDIIAEVDSAVASLGLQEAGRLHLYSADAFVCDDQVNLAVKKIKKIVSQTLIESGSKRIHLFLAGPAVFALLLGHRLNGLTDIQCYEWTGLSNYVPTCLLQAK